MSFEVTTEVVGVKEALRTLNTLDKRLRRQITQDYKEIVQPILTNAQTMTPTTAPLSGMNRNWTPEGSSQPVLPYQGTSRSREPRKPSKYQMNFPGGRRQYGKWAQWAAGQRAYISGKRPKSMGNFTRNLAAFGIQWQGPAAVLFDTSGQFQTPQGAQMVAALTARFGAPSRVMWRAYSRSEAAVQSEMRDLVNRIMSEAEAALERNA